MCSVCVLHQCHNLSEMAYALFSLTVLILSMGGECGEEEGIDKTLLGTKTAYDWATDVGSKPVRINQDMVIHIEDRRCTAIHVNMLLKHGSRYPGADFLENVQALAGRIRGNKAPAGDLDFIETWTSDLKPEDGYMLYPVGKEQMLGIGKRVGKRFHKLLSDKEGNLEFISSTRARTRDSGVYFSRGLSQSLYGTNDTTTPTENNHLMRIFDNCKYFEKTVDDNDKTTEELDRFKQTATFTGMVKNIVRRLKLIADFRLSDDDAMNIWEMCSYELLAGRNDTWCLMMDDDDRRVASFALDLQNYYESSYGNGVSGDIHCVLVKKVLQLMDDALATHKAGSNNYTVGSFMFGHVATVMGMATAFGLFKDDPPLRADDVNRDRQFVSSKISPMAGNLGFGLYECRNDDDTDTKYAVKLFHNERAMNMSSSGRQIYWYDDFRSAFADAAGCDIDALCKYPRDTSGTGAFETSAVALVLLGALSYFL